MAMTDQEYQRHLETWLGFGRLLRWAVTIIIIVLVLLAYFLL
jgi:Bacterial aa3 type cytochrome c oxidase subunit IV